MVPVFDCLAVDLPTRLHPKLRRFLDYWIGKTTPGRLPSRRDVDPMDLSDLLSGIYLVDVVGRPEAMRFRFRLLGTDHAIALGREVTGLYIDEAFAPPACQSIIESYRAVIDSRQPRFGSYTLPIEDRRHYAIDRVVAPLASDGVTVDMLAGMAVFRLASEIRATEE